MLGHPELCTEMLDERLAKKDAVRTRYDNSCVKSRIEQLLSAIPPSITPSRGR
jgi:hypothetical protein